MADRDGSCRGDQEKELVEQRTIHKDHPSGRETPPNVADSNFQQEKKRSFVSQTWIKVLKPDVFVSELT